LILANGGPTLGSNHFVPSPILEARFPGRGLSLRQMGSTAAPGSQLEQRQGQEYP
jgi:hypothetical protein